MHFTTIRTESSKTVLENTLATLLSAFAHESSSGTDGAEGYYSGETISPPSVPVLYQLYFEQPRGGDERPQEAKPEESPSSGTFRFPPLPVDLMVQDAPLDVVRDAWRRVMGAEADDAAYMAFVDREGNDADDMEYD